MSRFKNKKNKYDSDVDYSVEVDKIKPYSEDEAYEVYVPSTKPAKKKMSKGSKAILILFIIFFLLVIVLAGTFLALQSMGRKKLVSYDGAKISGIEQAVTPDDGKTVTYKGKKYRLNENITSIACLGVDKETLGTYKDKYGTAGQADTNMVLAIDTATGKVTVISIPRDTMVDIDLYTTSGQYVGSRNEQLCLAYAYGDGKHKSCENAVSSIQRVLFGIPVNSYISMDMQGIAVLNDAVGGVTVTSPETIGKFVQGQTVTLNGRDAFDFVRSRGQDVNASIRRTERQRAYVMAFANKAVNAAKKNIGSITRLYNTTMNYCCTNVGLSDVTYLATTLISKGISGVDTVTIPGEMKAGEVYGEYYIDTTATYELMLSIFYNEVA